METTGETDDEERSSEARSGRYEHVPAHLCEECSGSFEAGDELVSLGDGYMDTDGSYAVSNQRFWHRECFVENQPLAED